jgi:cytochrome c biogenesis protein CcmG, thiol:disulfide interchange protein DsbE
MSTESTESGLEPAVSKADAPTRSRPRWGRIVAWLGVFALLGIIFLGLLRAQQGQFKVGEKAPEFTLTTFDGKTYKLSDLKGKIVFLNIWASWCKPCEQEAADLEAAWRYYQPNSDVIFLGVAWTDTDDKSMEYLKKFDISYPNGPDMRTQISQDYRITGVPETYIIDRNGKLAYVKFSPFLSVEEIKAAIDPLLEN